MPFPYSEAVMRQTAIALALVLLSAPMTTAVVSRPSPTCKEAHGATARDLDNALTFCAANIPRDLEIQGVLAMESVLWLKVSQRLADVMRKNDQSTERIVKHWMKEWKTLSGSDAVTVSLELQDVEIARGQASSSGGDRVTVR